MVGRFATGDSGVTMNDDRLPLGKALLIICAVGAALFAVIFFQEDIGRVFQSKTPVAIGRDIETLTRTVSENPNDPQAYVELGWAHFIAGNAVAAQVAYREALAIEPGYVPAKLNLGIALNESGKVDEAERLFAEIVRTNPGHELAHFNLGVIHVKRRHYGKAIKELKSALKANPSSGDAWYYLGLAYERKGEKEQAISAYQKAIGFLPGHAEAKNALANLAQ